MISLEQMQDTLLSTYDSSYGLFVLSHPDDGLRILVKVPSELSDLEEWRHIDFPIGSIILDDLRSRGVLAPILHSAIYVGINIDGMYFVAPEEYNTDIANVARAIPFLVEVQVVKTLISQGE